MTASPMESTPTRHERPELTGDQLDALRRLLEADRASLLERAIVSVAEVGQIDSRSATHGRGETKQHSCRHRTPGHGVLEANTHDSLEEIGSALVRIEEGTYGFCQNCETPIPG
jgi:RNA polymerase-binding transcription factor DksA